MVDTARPRRPSSARVAASMRIRARGDGAGLGSCGPGTSRFPFLTAYGS